MCSMASCDRENVDAGKAEGPLVSKAGKIYVFTRIEKNKGDCLSQKLLMRVVGAQRRQTSLEGSGLGIFCSMPYCHPLSRRAGSVSALNNHSLPFDTRPSTLERSLEPSDSTAGGYLREIVM